MRSQDGIDPEPGQPGLRVRDTLVEVNGTSLMELTDEETEDRGESQSTHRLLVRNLVTSSFKFGEDNVSFEVKSYALGQWQRLTFPNQIYDSASTKFDEV